MVRVVVAVKPIKQGEVFHPSSLAVQEWPADKAPAYGITDISETTGKIAVSDIVPGQTIIRNMLK